MYLRFFKGQQWKEEIFNHERKAKIATSEEVVNRNRIKNKFKRKYISSNDNGYYCLFF